MPNISFFIGIEDIMTLARYEDATYFTGIDDPTIYGFDDDISMFIEFDYLNRYFNNKSELIWVDFIPSVMGYTSVYNYEGANSNAKLAFTNTATYCTNCEVNGYTVPSGIYAGSLTYSGTEKSYKKNGKDLGKALKVLMGSEDKNAGYYAICINESGVPCWAYWSLDSRLLEIVDDPNASGEMTFSYLVGGYPNEQFG